MVDKCNCVLFVDWQLGDKVIVFFFKMLEEMEECIVNMEYEKVDFYFVKKDIGELV